MTSRLKKVGIPILILVGAIAIAVGMSGLRKAPVKVEEQRLALLVNTELLDASDLTYRIASQGTVSPKLQTTLISEVNGRIVAVSEHFVSGGFFQEGDVLVQVEQADYLTAVKATEAALAGAKAQLEEEKARARVAEAEWRSFTEGKAPALGLRQPQLASALANVQSKEADLERAKRDLSRTEIRAPYAGMVASRAANLGQFISRGSQLGMIMGTDVAEVRLPLSDTDFGFLPQQAANDQNIPVTLSATVAGQPQQWLANIVRTEGIMDERSRVIYAVAEVLDPYQRNASGTPLQFGRFVQAEIQGVTANQVTKIPRHLLKPGKQILVVDTYNLLQFRTVELDRADAAYAYITAGIEAGDKLVTSPVTNPLAGTLVRLSAAEIAVPATQDTSARVAEAAKPAEGQ